MNTDDLDFPDWHENKGYSMEPEPTLPPVRQPNTPRVWLPRIWKWLTESVAAHPDLAIILFTILLVLAVIF